MSGLGTAIHGPPDLNTMFSCILHSAFERDLRITICHDSVLAIVLKIATRLNDMTMQCREKEEKIHV